jgi:hypothetical protein
MSLLKVTILGALTRGGTQLFHAVSHELAVFRGRAIAIATTMSEI